MASGSASLDCLERPGGDLQRSDGVKEVSGECLLLRGGVGCAGSIQLMGGDMHTGEQERSSLKSSEDGGREGREKSCEGIHKYD